MSSTTKTHPLHHYHEKNHHPIVLVVDHHVREAWDKLDTKGCYQNVSIPESPTTVEGFTFHPSKVEVRVWIDLEPQPKHCRDDDDMNESRMRDAANCSKHVLTNRLQEVFRAKQNEEFQQKSDPWNEDCHHRRSRCMQRETYIKKGMPSVKPDFVLHVCIVATSLGNKWKRLLSQQQSGLPKLMVLFCLQSTKTGDIAIAGRRFLCDSRTQRFGDLLNDGNNSLYAMKKMAADISFGISHYVLRFFGRNGCA
mmetsp:Transcript_6159/g.8811  ORF Transcript_6159/g.8811 Transcript_6159/m.8811 type:complete len:252 (+) Transcript_6159:595-1350(+)